MAALRENVPRNRIEYAMWDEAEVIPESSLGTNVPGKYRSTVSNILSKHCTEVRLTSEDMIQTSSHLSKKKLKDLITKQNNEIFSFMTHSAKVPESLGVAETIFRRYGREIPSIKIQNASIADDLKLDITLDRTLSEFNDELVKHRTIDGVCDYITQTRWLSGQYKTIGEEVLRLETILFQKIDLLDKLHQRIPMITSLTHNDALADLVDSFSKYAESVYESSHFEENYHQLVEAYKKWNVCRELLSVQSVMKKDSTEPSCSICLLESVAYTIVPCCPTYCGGCSKKQNTTCFICRGPIRERVKLYFA
jgi:hypothetical protein